MLHYEHRLKIDASALAAEDHKETIKLVAIKLLINCFVIKYKIRCSAWLTLLQIIVNFNEYYNEFQMIAVMFSTLTSFIAVLSNKTLSAFSCSATETMGVFTMASVKLVKTVLSSSLRV